MRRIVLAGIVVASAAASAAADPVLDQVTSKTAKSGVVTVTAEATFTAAGVLSVSGDVNGANVLLKKKMKAGHRTLKFAVDPKKLGLGRKLTTGLHFALSVAAVETASGTQTSQNVTADLPVPCVLLPGLGDEQTPGGFNAFATALDGAMGGRYGFGGKASFMTVHEYASLTKSLASLGAEVDKVVKTALKGTPFSKVDIVGYSYGGVVARSYLSQTGGARVRDCVFLGSPNEGAPIAYIGVGLLNNNLLGSLLGQNAVLAAEVGTLVNNNTKGALRNLYPTFPWLTGNPLTVAVATTILGDATTPLTALNKIAPPTGVQFDAFYYSSVPSGQIATVDQVDVATLSGGLAGTSSFDPAQIATGSGDGVVPAHSVTMDDTSAWHLVITGHDLGSGTHVTMPADPNVLSGVAAVLGQ